MKFKFNNIRFFLGGSILALGMISCELDDLDINVDPNSASQASLELLLTNSQWEGISTFGGGLNNTTMGFQAINTSSDDFNFTNSSWNGTWNFLYSGPLKDLEELIAAADPETNPKYLGIAQILKAYYFTMMVDLWGDVPYTQAFKGNALGEEKILEPVYDKGADIYADAFSLIDKGIANLTGTTGTVKGDIIYGGNATKWIKMANSLKLRLLIQTRNVQSNGAAIQAIVDGGNYIKSAADDFVLRYGAMKNPDNRHPMYQAGYVGGDAGYSYFGHQLMTEMLASKDPRTPFYFKRQTATILNPEDPTDKQTIPCSQRTDCTYGYFPLSNFVAQAVFGKDASALTSKQAAYLAGFFGRDRSDPSGIPNDNPLRTTTGAYPGAGLFDATFGTTGGNKYGKGDGIFPIITSWMTKFYILEAQITLGVNSGSSDADLLAAALTDQFAKVWSVGIAADANAKADVTTWPDNYSQWAVEYKTQSAFIADVKAGYDATATQNARLGYVLKQAWKANFGNGFEGYNAFRRTGLPADIQAPMQLPRQYALSFPYAQDEVNLNSNTPSKVYDSPSSAVFWDTLKFQF
ncbi:MAG: SusD/RagB family nutrient-binding outer membrane lipoprotein [Flavobacteriaceae bacterium]